MIVRTGTEVILDTQALGVVVLCGPCTCGGCESHSALHGPGFDVKLHWL